MTALSIEIDITIQDERWNQITGDIKNLIHNVVSKVLYDYLNKIENAEISIVLCDDPFIQAMNKQYRRKDSPTNVLSFPMSEPDELENPAGPFCALGDIVLAYETILREAKEQNKTFEDHCTHMLVHGCLHLLHYDHINDESAEIMEKLEAGILNKMGIKNPYESE